MHCHRLACSSRHSQDPGPACDTLEPCVGGKGEHAPCGLRRDSPSWCASDVLGSADPAARADEACRQVEPQILGRAGLVARPLGWVCRDLRRGADMLGGALARRACVSNKRLGANGVTRWAPVWQAPQHPAALLRCWQSPSCEWVSSVADGLSNPRHAHQQGQGMCHTNAVTYSRLWSR